MSNYSTSLNTLTGPIPADVISVDRFLGHEAVSAKNGISGPLVVNTDDTYVNLYNSFSFSTRFKGLMPQAVADATYVKETECDDGEQPQINVGIVIIPLTEPVLGESVKLSIRFAQILENIDDVNDVSLDYYDVDFVYSFNSATNINERVRLDKVIDVDKIRGGMPYNIRISRDGTHVDDDFAGNLFLEAVEVYNPRGMILPAACS